VLMHVYVSVGWIKKIFYLFLNFMLLIYEGFSLFLFIKKFAKRFNFQKFI